MAKDASPMNEKNDPSLNNIQKPMYTWFLKLINLSILTNGQVHFD
jgi:hypothetical protein